MLNNSFQVRASHSLKTKQFIFDHNTETGFCHRLQISPNANDGVSFLHQSTNSSYFCQKLIKQCNDSFEVLLELDKELISTPIAYSIFYISNMFESLAFLSEDNRINKECVLFDNSLTRFIVTPYKEVIPVVLCRKNVLDSCKLKFNTFKEVFDSNLFQSGQTVLDQI